MKHWKHANGCPPVAHLGCVEQQGIAIDGPMTIRWHRGWGKWVVRTGRLAGASPDLHAAIRLWVDARDDAFLNEMAAEVEAEEAGANQDVNPDPPHPAHYRRPRGQSTAANEEEQA